MCVCVCAHQAWSSQSKHTSNLLIASHHTNYRLCEELLQDIVLSLKAELVSHSQDLHMHIQVAYRNASQTFKECSTNVQIYT